jgi:hypothetical protein
MENQSNLLERRYTDNNEMEISEIINPRSLDHRGKYNNKNKSDLIKL